MDHELRRRRLTASHLEGKIREFHFHLRAVVAGCDASSVEAAASGSKSYEDAVIFGFSALSNCVQALKDALHITLAAEFPWSNIHAARHGKFMHHVRNAMTHDGHPVISAWSNGLFYVPTNIVRLDHRNKLVEIEAPTTDIRSLCLEFSTDFCRDIRAVLEGIQSDTALHRPPMEPSEVIEAAMRSSLMPAYVKEALASDSNAFAEFLANEPHDPVGKAISALDRVIFYCKEKLATACN